MEPDDGAGFDALDWFRRFCALYNQSAASPLTELGLFYERHRAFEEFGQRSDPGNPEYTDEEWNRVMAGLLGGLADSLGLVQASYTAGGAQLEWFLPGIIDRPSVVIRETSEASSGILTNDLAELSHHGAGLAVILMYPDYPRPEGASTFDEAVLAWRGRIEKRLRRLRPPHEMLTLMISAYSFDLPAPWRGFVWKPGSQALEAAH